MVRLEVLEEFAAFDGVREWQEDRPNLYHSKLEGFDIEDPEAMVKEVERLERLRRARWAEERRQASLHNNSRRTARTRFMTRREIRRQEAREAAKKRCVVCRREIPLSARHFELRKVCGDRCKKMLLQRLNRRLRFWFRRRQGSETLRCSHCHETIEATRANYRRFCSVDCAQAYHRVVKIRRKIAERVIPAVSCEWCHTSFVPKRLRKGDAANYPRYCCVNHKNNAIRARKKKSATLDAASGLTP